MNNYKNNSNNNKKNDNNVIYNMPNSPKQQIRILIITTWPNYTHYYHCLLLKMYLT